MPAEVIKLGEPENEAERQSILYLRNHLPEGYRLYTNLELPGSSHPYEIDIILVAPHAVYVVDVKGVYGRVEVTDTDWYPEGRSSYASPLKNYRQHARVLKGLIQDADRFQKDALKKIWVQATVLLTAEDVEIIDTSRDCDQIQDIVQLGEPCLKYFKDWQRFESQGSATKITQHLSVIDRAIRGRSQPRSRPQHFGSWQVIEKLGEKEGKYVEYLARKSVIGLSNRTSRLRVYAVDPWLTADERKEAHRLISTAFQAVNDLPSHDNILQVQDIFESQDADGMILVTEDIKGRSLRQLIRTQELTLEQCLEVVGDVLRALEHIHNHGVVHRNITPDNILITPEKQAKLTGFDYARIENRTATIADAIADELEAYSLYQDFDCQNNPSQACEQSDLFSAGQVFYELLMGTPAFTSVDQLVETSGRFLTLPSQKHPDLPQGFDEWLQKLCAFDRRDRFPNARVALDQLTPLSRITPDLTNLATGVVLNNQYKVIERLGKPGSFAVAYKVLHDASEDFQVLKIVVRDNYSLFERFQQEFKALYKVLKNPHPHIVTVRWTDKLHDYNNTPFLVFEYVDGQDLGERLASSALSLEEALDIWQQTAMGLAHLHANGIYHQDIKPSNLLLTPQGVKIIDFNAAVTTADEFTPTAGTRRYLPPDFKPSITSSKAERIDWDLYALGITAYECITGHYPFNAAQPVVGQACLDPRQFESCANLSEELVALMQRAIAPRRDDRFSSAEDLLAALQSLPSRQLPLVLEATPPVEPDPTPRALPETPDLTIPPALPTVETPLEQPAPEPIALELITPDAPVIAPSVILPEPSPQQMPEQMPVPAAIAPSPPPDTSHLFTPIPPDPQAYPDPDRPVVLDPTKAYPVPQGFMTIDTELDWIRSFGNGSPCWVRGKTLCAWAEAWLHSWQRSHQIAQIKQPPREKLAALLTPIAVPTDWTDAQCLMVVTRLEHYPQHPIAHLLAELTESDLQIWLAEPSINNLAAWLAIQVPDDARVLEQAWQAQRRHHPLGNYYATTDKSQLLKQWLGIADHRPSNLDLYPKDLYPKDLDIPAWLVSEFETYWERELHRTEGKVLEERSLGTLAVPTRIAAVAYRVLRQQPIYSTRAREASLRPYLAHNQYQELQQRQRPPEPTPLDINASPQEALRWATEDYLPLRHWETVIAQVSQDQQMSDCLATSFEDWILTHYPQIKVDAVAQSWLNYNVAHHIQHLSQTAPLLWVVVDGLGWLDHQTLLGILQETKQIQVDRGLQARFSILPTKTEYAKWSLYSQRLPGHESWQPSAGKGFTWHNAKRYTDDDVHKGRLQKDLQQGKYALYCWDTDGFDRLYHHGGDWLELYNVERLRVLKAIAEDILRFVAMHPQADQMTVAIASDHGQLMGVSTKLTHVPPQLDLKGRMAIGSTDDPRFVVLAKQDYDLPHDITVVRGSTSFNSFSYTDDKHIIGCHGGLYPEEVVIGFSVLKRSVQRAPVIVTVTGEGRPHETGQLTITIHNPNPIALEQLSIVVQEIPALRSGRDLEIKIAANDKQSVRISFPDCPELPLHHPDKRLILTGQLNFTYQQAEVSSVELDRRSALEINQIFSSGIEGGLDDFLA